jgi:hypothetical protein
LGVIALFLLLGLWPETKAEKRQRKAARNRWLSDFDGFF